jgi:hypothetical protein
MLMMIGYDLAEPADRNRILGDALSAIGVDHNLRNMVWLVDTGEPPGRVLARITTHLGLAKGHPKAADRLVVLPICTGGCWAQRGLRKHQPAEAIRLIENGLGREDRGAVLAVAYTLHRGADYRAFRRAIEELAIYRQDGYCHPLEGVSFLATDRTPAAVSEELAKSLPNRAGKDRPDELFVVRVRAGETGAEYGLDAEVVEWFGKRRIKLQASSKAAAKRRSTGPRLHAALRAAARSASPGQTLPA